MRGLAKTTCTTLNPERNPNLLDMPFDLPVGAHENRAALWDKEADLRNGTLEDEYRTAVKAYIGEKGLGTTTAAPAVTAGKRKYMCSRCGVPRKGHVCPQVAQLKKRKHATVRAAVKRARKQPLPGGAYQ